MGAMTFEHQASGATAREAFCNAVEQAQYEWGHAGYTGTIAEKHRFVMIPCPPNVDPYKYAWDLIDNGDRRISDKWGPAGCIAMGNGEYLFFGWASS